MHELGVDIYLGLLETGRMAIDNTQIHRQSHQAVRVHVCMTTGSIQTVSQYGRDRLVKVCSRFDMADPECQNHVDM